MAKEKWVLINRRGDWNALAEEFGIDPLIAKLMINRGITDRESAEAYLYASMKSLAAPELMKDAEKAADIIEKAVADGQKIVIASDYDVDGIFSGQVLREGLRAIGNEPVILTPDRVAEGYGLNRRIVDEAKAMGASLIVTCDNGIAAGAEIEYASELGITTVVTDHHEVPFSETDGVRKELLPPAAAVVDPHREDCPYPFKKLCGTGVALRLIELIFNRRGMKLPERFIAYAAVATISDVMDLTGENRVLVKEGLRVLNIMRHVGLDALIAATDLHRKELEAYHLGFVIGPCFNAAGRLETTEKAQRLLDTDDPVEAQEIAEHLRQLNEKRKSMTDEGEKKAIELIESRGELDKILLVRLHDCHESIAGIIAGRIKERYSRPVFVFTDAVDGLKGSGRSVEAYHMFRGLTACGDLLTRFGGHAMAAGLSLKEDRLEELRRRLNEDCGLTEEDLTPIIRIDSRLPFDYINEKLVSELTLLEPTGRENPKPVFAESRVTVRRLDIIGKNQNVIKMRVTNASGAAIDALLFRDAEEFRERLIRTFGESAWDEARDGAGGGVEMSVIFTPDINEYNGISRKQAIIQKYRFTGEDE